MNKSSPFKYGPLHAVSKEQAVYEQIRHAIVSAELKSGERIIPAELADQLKISSMPIRNALMRLEAERLVTRAPHREFVVTPYSSREIRELYAVRAVLDGFAARLAAERMTSKTLDKLRVLLKRSEQCLAEGDIHGLAAANRDFHRTLYSEAGNGQLLELVETLRDRSAPYRIASYHRTEIHESTVQEHREILLALTLGDADAVERLIRKDMENTGNALAQLTEEEVK